MAPESDTNPMKAHGLLGGSLCRQGPLLFFPLLLHFLLYLSASGLLLFFIYLFPLFSSLFSFFSFLWLHHKAYGFLVPQTGLEPTASRIGSAES